MLFFSDKICYIFSMKKTFLQFNKAFTLAEVLITLVIIGVIAAVTIPTVINNTKKQEYVSKLKKVYSTLSAATNKILFEYGNPNASIGGWCDTVENMAAMYKKHIQISRDCGFSTGCIENTAYIGFNGSATDWQLDQHNWAYKLVMADGAQLYISTVSDSCSDNNFGGQNVCGHIFVDINGSKKPNKFGKDFFLFELREDGLHPTGCETDTCSGVYAYGCACKVIRENAMNY